LALKNQGAKAIKRISTSIPAANIKNVAIMFKPGIIIRLALLFIDPISLFLMYREILVNLTNFKFRRIRHTY